MAPRFLFGLFYRIGFMPWDGHGLAPRLLELVEGPERLPPARAIDIGCGTGDTSIYLARHGWQVTAFDFVKRALKMARKKIEKAGVEVRLEHADATRMASAGLGDGFTLAVDNGCLHGIPVIGRDGYVRDIGKIVRPGGRLLLMAFDARPRRRGPTGISGAEIERRFSPEWEILGAKVEPSVSNDPDDPIYAYELRRR